MCLIVLLLWTGRRRVVGITTTEIFALQEMLVSVDLPESHVFTGVVQNLPESGLNLEDQSVRCAPPCPAPHRPLLCGNTRVCPLLLLCGSSLAVWVAHRAPQARPFLCSVCQLCALLLVFGCTWDPSVPIPFHNRPLVPSDDGAS
jgi:hypothetical protein